MDRSVTLTLFLGLAAGWELRGDLSPAHVAIEELFERSDTVIRGRCESVHAVSAAADHEGYADYLAAVSVLTVYKGDPQNPITVRFPDRSVAAGAPPCGGTTWLLFLKASEADRTFVLSDPNFGMRYLPGNVSTSGPSQPGVRVIEADLARIMTESRDADAVNALRILADLERLGPSSIALLQAMSQRPDLQVSTLALEMLARADPIRYFEAFVHAFETARPDDPLIAVRLCELAQSVGSSKQLPALRQMVDWTLYPGLRECAMQGIRKLKVSAAVPFLVQHLDDPQDDVSYLALITLAEMVGKNGDFAPGFGLYVQNRQKYRELWHDWWKVQGAAEYPPDGTSR